LHATPGPDSGAALPATAETTRFAPSPTGALHLGHALAAITAHDLARRSAGRFLLRIEDLDAARCRAEHEAGVRADLAWLGLAWDGPVLRQSEHLPRYRDRLAELGERGLTYPCFCTRGAIAAEIARMPVAPQGPDGPPYPGTCRALGPAERAARIAAGAPFALRLDVAGCLAAIERPLGFEETGRGPGGEHGAIEVDPARLGDIVLGRKDIGVSYHLAVVLDDHAQGVTLVTRGEDLFPATHVQRLLQAVLALEVPRYHHHRLVCDASGRRLAKSAGAESLAALREAGATPAGLRARLGLAGAQIA
jgi:glutamyl-Q tRNA(Asp) synthetase